ncbi:MAG: Ig-like domain-containing protein [Anaerolineales bacterium]
MKKTLFIALVFALILATPALAQEETPALTLRLNRDFGYGGFANDIEGLFSLIAEGPDDLTRVNFYIDDELINSDDAVPWRHQFSTKDFDAGVHRLYAEGSTINGQTLRSNEIVRVFLTSEEAKGKIVGLLGPLLGLVVAIMLLTAGLPMLFGRKKPEIGKYGVSGGAVCVKCGLPFPLHFFSMHFGRSNLERCPHCGKWVWVRRAKADDLIAAQARWRGDETKPSGKGESGRLKQQIDDSRYEK